MEPSDYFRIALRICLEERGRGAQAALAKAVGVSRSHLNDFLAGRKPLPEVARVRIARKLGGRYEQMLCFGRLMCMPLDEPHAESQTLKNREVSPPLEMDAVLQANHFSKPGLVKEIYHCLKKVDRMQPAMLYPMLEYLKEVKNTLNRPRNDNPACNPLSGADEEQTTP